MVLSGWWCCQGVDAIIQCKIVGSRLRNASKTTSKIKSVEQQNYWTGSMVRCWERAGGEAYVVEWSGVAEVVWMIQIQTVERASRL